jgi:hypothetical protein
VPARVADRFPDVKVIVPSITPVALLAIVQRNVGIPVET